MYQYFKLKIVLCVAVNCLALYYAPISVFPYRLVGWGEGGGGGVVITLGN